MDELQAICDVCTFPIGDGEGFLFVDSGDAQEFATAERPSSMTLDDMINAALVEEWTTAHTRCNTPDDHPQAYAIEVDRIRTYRAALSWTAHLMGKPWLTGTNWDQLLQQLCEGTRQYTGLRRNEG